MTNIQRIRGTYDILEVRIDPSPNIDFATSMTSSGDHSLGYKLDMAGIKVLSYVECDCGYLVEFACEYGSNIQGVKKELLRCFKEQYRFRRKTHGEEIDDIIMIDDPYSVLVS